MLQPIYGVDARNDVAAFAPGDGNFFVANGLSSRLDAAPLFFSYESTSTATPDGISVLCPSSITPPAPGRYIRRLLAYADLAGLPTIPAGAQAYEGTTQRLGAFPIIKSATVASGVAVFNLTVDGTAGAATLFPNGIILDSINLYVNDATAAYQMSFAMSNSNKTVTVTANKLTTANILTGILGQAAANGAVIKLQIWGY